LAGRTAGYSQEVGRASSEIRAWLDARSEDLFAELSSWVRIPSVAGVPEHEPDLQRSANWLAGAFRETGFPSVEVWPTDGAPAVFAEWPAAGPQAATILVYSHHDVRAAKDELWQQTKPFEPVLRDGRIYGRGSSDAKGQVLTHLAAVRACLALGADAPLVGLKFLVEGEEEVGSPNLAELIDRRRGRLDADFVVLSDTLTWSAERPAICVGMRGLVHAELEVRGPVADVHAGAVSGVAPNPIAALAALLARLVDDQGRITVPGFYDDVEEGTADERRELAELTADEADWLRRSGTRAVVGEAGRSLGERLYLRPAIEVVSILGGDALGASRGAIPAEATAMLQVSLVPDQNPKRVGEQLRNWVAAHVAPEVEYELTISPIMSPAYATPPDHPALPVLQECMSEGFEVRARRMRNSGSGPAVLLAERLAAPVLFFGTGLPEDNWHADDESMALDVLVKGATTLALFWQRIAESAHGRESQ
jgi:acetylornithine deacetylase/succinyl-diaminopimelate desuccinylase-like protein